MLVVLAVLLRRYTVTRRARSCSSNTVAGCTLGPRSFSLPLQFVPCTSLSATQASLCLLGLLWRATAAGDSHARAHLLNSSALLTALTTRVAEGDFDAMFAAREVAADQRGAVALEKAGALRAVCGALRKLVAAARAAAGEAEGEGAAGTDGEEEPGGAAARAAGAGPAKSPAAKSPAAKSPGKKQLALAGAGKGAGGGVRAPPGLTGRSPSPSKKAVVVSVEGVTEGGEETERAAAGVLVAGGQAGSGSERAGGRAGGRAMCEDSRAGGVEAGYS